MLRFNTKGYHDRMLAKKHLNTYHVKVQYLVKSLTCNPNAFKYISC